MALYNESLMIGEAIAGLVTITGSLFITFLVITLLLMAAAMMFRLPVEMSAILIVPILLVGMAYDGGLVPIGLVFLIYMGILFAKNLPIYG